MKLKTLIIDDEPIALNKLRNYVEKTPFLTLCGACSGAVEAMEMMAGGNEPDVIFTDINMPDLNGMEMAGALIHPPLIVFITAYSEYAAESYRHSAVDYLLKPYSFADFQRAANRVLERYTQSHAEIKMPDGNVVNDDSSLFVKVDYRYVRINLADIRYIKGYGEYLQIYVTDSQSPLLTLSSFAAIKGRLSESFIQIHRSYIVNMNNVKHIERARIIMDSDTYLPVGDSYKNALQSYLASHAIGGAGSKKNEIN